MQATLPITTEIETTTTPAILAFPLAEPPSATRKSRGKVASKPKETRDMINRMLDDNLPYKIIIEELGEAGEGLTEQNLCNWKATGYQLWLKHQEKIAELQSLAEFATDLLLQAKGTASAREVQEACLLVTSLQQLQALMDHGQEALKGMLKTKPASYLKLVHSLCQVSHETMKTEKFKSAQSLAQRLTHQAESSSIKVNQATANTPTAAETSFPSPRGEGPRVRGNGAFPTPTAQPSSLTPSQPSASQAQSSTPFPSQPSTHQAESSSIKVNQGDSSFLTTSDFPNLHLCEPTGDIPGQARSPKRDGFTGMSPQSPTSLLL